MVLAFDFIHSSASTVAPKLSTMEYNNVLESLMLISNVWNDIAKQSAFLGSLFNASEWQQISAIVDTPQSFVTIFPEAIFLEKRSLMLRNLHSVFSSLRRVKKITKSGFSAALNGSKSNGDNVTSNNGGIDTDLALHPAYDHVCPLLPIVLKLVKTLHSLLENPELRYVQDLSEGERITVIGLHMIDHASIVADQEKDKSHKENIKVSPRIYFCRNFETNLSSYIQTFVLSLQELAYGILGESCQAFGSRFYTIPQLSDAYLSFGGFNSHLMNDFRLRNLIRNVFKPFLISCPPAQAPTVVIPFAQKFFPFSKCAK